MLQSPTYATTRPSSGASSGLADRLSKFLRGGNEVSQQGTRRTVNKENTPSIPSAQLLSSSAVGKIGDSDLASALKSDPHTAITNVQSSLMSADQAHYYLSQSNEAEAVHTASPYPQWDRISPSQNQRMNVGFPYATFSNAHTTTHVNSAFRDQDDTNHCIPSSPRHMPVSFGYDGGADSQTSQTKQESKTPEQRRPDFDYRGVTHADYEVMREDPNTTWHKGEVDDLFQELATKEREEIESHRQSQGNDNA